VWPYHEGVQIRAIPQEPLPNRSQVRAAVDLFSRRDEVTVWACSGRLVIETRIQPGGGVQLDSEEHCDLDVPDAPMEELDIPHELLVEYLRPGQGIGIEVEPGGFAMVGVNARNVQRWETRAEIRAL
jgi:hypothetical protein